MPGGGGGDGASDPTGWGVSVQMWTLGKLTEFQGSVNVFTLNVEGFVRCPIRAVELSAGLE